MTHPSYNTAVVHTGQTHPAGTPINRQRIDGDWSLRSKNPAAQAAYLAPFEFLEAVAPRRGVLTIIDVRCVIGYSIITGTGRDKDKVVFTTAPVSTLPDQQKARMLQSLIGHPAPVMWRQGETWPIKETTL